MDQQCHFSSSDTTWNIKTQSTELKTTLQPTLLLMFCGYKCSPNGSEKDGEDYTAVLSSMFCWLFYGKLCYGLRIAQVGYRVMSWWTLAKLLGCNC